jgi:hypothetical protein
MIGSALQAIANSALVSRPQRLGLALIDRLGLTTQPWLAFPDLVPITLLNGMEFERPEARCRQSFVR